MSDRIYPGHDPAQGADGCVFAIGVVLMLLVVGMLVGALFGIHPIAWLLIFGG